jgi:hypothetical protein
MTRAAINAGFKVLRRAVMLAALSVTTASCMKYDLGNSCLPLKTPANVQLMRAVPIYPSAKADVELGTQPIKKLDRFLAPGTRLRVERISQTAKVDVSHTNIEVRGKLADGRSFFYVWGYGRDLERAPWEGDGTPALRTMPCAHR